MSQRLFRITVPFLQFRYRNPSEVAFSTKRQLSKQSPLTMQSSSKEFSNILGYVE